MGQVQKKACPIALSGALPVKNREIRNLFILGWLCVSAVTIFAQTALTGGLRGVVTDKAGAALSGAQVTVESRSLGRKATVTTDAQGRFTALGLTPATDYVVSVTATNFKAAQREAVTITSEETLALDLSLEIAQVNESVNIVANSEAALATSPELSSTLDAQRLRELPLNGRLIQRAALMNPHVRNTSGLGGGSECATPQRIRPTRGGGVAGNVYGAADCE
jgi:hypothetical protein